MLSTAKRIRRRIKGLEPGAVFTPAELVSQRLGTPKAIRSVLERLTRDGAVQRISKGYYYVPQVSPLIGPLSPTTEAILAAVSRKMGVTIARPLLETVNRLGLSDQVVARPQYRGNVSRRRDLEIGGHHITIRPAGVRSISREADLADLIIDALKGLRMKHITDIHVAKLRDLVHKHDFASRLQRRAAQRAPQWMLPIIERIIAKKTDKAKQ